MRHYHVSTEARWMGEVVGPEALASGPNPWAGLFGRSVAHG